MPNFSRDSDKKRSGRKAQAFELPAALPGRTFCRPSGIRRIPGEISSFRGGNTVVPEEMPSSRGKIPSSWENGGRPGEESHLPGQESTVPGSRQVKLIVPVGRPARLRQPLAFQRRIFAPFDCTHWRTLGADLRFSKRQIGRKRAPRPRPA